MTSRARRLSSRQHPARGRGPIAGRAATDEFVGLGRVEQLVLRGDGLTTTSLEILTGDHIDVMVDGHWRVTVPAAEPAAFSGTFLVPGVDDAPDVDEYFGIAVADLAAKPGDVLLVRNVLLVGAEQQVHASAEVIALSARLSQDVANALSTTNQPIGRLLRDHGVQVSRELQYWGQLAAGSSAARLGKGLTSASVVLGRTYLMRLSPSGEHLAVLTERFAPHVFAARPAPGEAGASSTLRFRRRQWANSR